MIEYGDQIKFCGGRNQEINMKRFNLTPNQEQVMETLWRANRPLVRSEIIDLTEDRHWSESSIHLLINELLEKEAIKVDGEILMGINMARQYSPAITRDEFNYMQMRCHMDQLHPSINTLLKFFEDILNQPDIDSQVLDQFQALIDTKRKQI